MTDPLAPTFLLAGAARSGTTALMEDLGRHPSVYVTEPKEPHFLALGERRLDFRGPGDDLTVNRLAVTDASAYKDLFRDAGDATARGEGSVSTLYYATRSIERMRRYAPDAHVVVILRDPASRAFSAFQYLRARGFEPLDDFRAALDSEGARVDGRWHHLWHYTGMGRYGEQLGHFRDRLGAERLTVCFFDDLVARRDELLPLIFSRLDVPPWVPPAEGERVNASGTPRSALVQSLVRLPVRHPRARAIGRAVVPHRIWRRLRNANLAPAEIPADAQEQIREELRADRDVLQGVLATMPSSVLGAWPPWLA